MASQSSGGAARNAAAATWARHSKRLRMGTLAALATALPVIPGTTRDQIHLAALAVGCLALGFAALSENRGQTGRGFVLLAAGTLGVGLFDVLATRPALALGLGLVVVVLSSRANRPLPMGGLDLAEPASLPTWGALGPVLLTAIAVGTAARPSLVAELAATATGLLGAGFAVLSYYGVLSARSGVRRLGLTVWLLGITTAAVALDDVSLRLFGLAVATSTVPLADLVEGRRGRPFGTWLAPIFLRPALMLVVTFAVTAGLGGLLLWLPLSSAAGAIDGIDALFTAVSATCVTGLIVLDTPNAFSGFGLAVLLVLIQIGGLGIMTFSTATLAFLRRRPSIGHERALAGLFVVREGQDHQSAVKDVLLVTGAVELGGGILLAALFWLRHGDGFWTALWRGLFTSISAFCNAGFALQSDSLVPYSTDPLVLYTVCAIITIGGLGPVATLAIGDLARRRRVSIPVQIVLVTSLVLLASGTLLFAAFEWQASLRGLSAFDKIHNAVFQSVTLRTAGFNSVDYGGLRPESQVMMVFFMLVGGSPGSTAGGIKTTTLAVVLLSMVAVLRGRPEALVRKRRIDHATFYRAVAITVLGVGSGFVLWLLLLLTQPVGPIAALFEAYSAVGTVGISVGATGLLDDVGKLLVVAGMFAGRLGPLTLLLLFAARTRPPRVTHPETGVPVG